MKPSWKALQIAFGLVGFFVVLAIAAGVTKAAAATLSIVVAYFVEFYVFRATVRLVTRHAVKPPILLICAFTVVAGALLAYLHLADILVIAITGLFAMDAMILRFRYNPIK